MKTQEFIIQFNQHNTYFRPAPFWFWNDDLKEEHLLFQMKEMKEKGIDEFLIHARRGLSVPYLSEKWFEKISFCIEKAKELGMTLWLYDEENWPSGYAGGKVIKENPDFCGKFLQKLAKNEKLPKDAKLIATIGDYNYYQDDCLYPPAYATEPYVDMLNADATRCFIKHTHAEYHKRFGKYFGNIIKGFFVDEPGFYNNFEMYNYSADAGSYTWTAKLPEYFKEIKGYDLISNVNKLWDEENPENLKFRLDYYDVLSKVFRKNYLAELRLYCESVGVKLIGHLHNEEFMPYHAKCLGDMLTDLQELHWSGIDRIDCNTQKLTEKYGSSAEHIYQMQRTMSETFCFSGWDLNPERMRFLTNYQFVRGVNMLVPHALYSSIEGDRKWECPPTLFFQNHYWKYFKQYTDYVTRLSFALTQGDFVGTAAVYYPITTMQQLVKSRDLTAANYYDRLFIDGCNSLLENQIDFDILNDEGLSKCKIEKSILQMNNCTYKFFAIFNLKNISKNALDKIVEFAKSGLPIIYIGNFEEFVCVDMTEKELNIAKEEIKKGKFCNIRHFDYHKPYVYDSDGKKIFEFAKFHNCLDIVLFENDDKIRYMHRKIADGDLYFIVNESNSKKKNTLKTNKEYKFAYHFDVFSGKVTKQILTDDRLNFELIAFGEDMVLMSDIDINCEIFHQKNKLKTIEICLDKGWKLDGKRIELKCWADLDMPNYSGFKTYENEFELTLKNNKLYKINLGKIYHTAELFINDKLVNEFMFAPFEADISTYLKNGKNTIKVIVGNTLANEIEQKPYISGMFGDIKLISEDKIK